MNLIEACKESDGTGEYQKEGESKVFLVESPWNLIDDDRARVRTIEVNGSFNNDEDAEADEGEGEALHLYYRVDSVHPPQQLLVQLYADEEDQGDESAEHAETDENCSHVFFRKGRRGPGDGFLVILQNSRLLASPRIALNKVMVLEPCSRPLVEEDEPDGAEEEDAEGEERHLKIDGHHHEAA